MLFFKFRLRGIEKLPSVIKKVKNNVYMIMAYNEYKLKNLNFDKLSTYIPMYIHYMLLAKEQVS
jgi:hypothetical protein